MSRQNKHTKGIAVQEGEGKNLHYEQHESYDDSMLPDAIELDKLKALDPTIIDWIKERTAKEQDSRLDFNHRKMALLENGQKCAVRVDIYSMTCALIIILAGMVLSAYLIHEGSSTTGTMFAGGTIIIAVVAFLNFRKKTINLPVGTKIIPNPQQSNK